MPFVVAMPCRPKLEGMVHAHLKVLPDAVLELIEELVAISVTEAAVLQHDVGGEHRQAGSDQRRCRHTPLERMLELELPWVRWEQGRPPMPRASYEDETEGETVVLRRRSEVSITILAQGVEHAP